ncbi:dual-specificity kinase [Malassezia cuniculi]|uniref:dual-specificity kinase n=1 Tax=Malassezia cuniculi TaxID=948313 RepID=A0AAF0ERU5_9BASI|nr:dual-specificity kinase [Malassezia cuniculi]
MPTTPKSIYSPARTPIRQTPGHDAMLSPTYDRTGQIGLGELSTPRWAALHPSAASPVTPGPGEASRPLLQEFRAPGSSAALSSVTDYVSIGGASPGLRQPPRRTSRTEESPAHDDAGRRRSSAQIRGRRTPSAHVAQTILRSSAQPRAPDAAHSPALSIEALHRIDGIHGTSPRAEEQPDDPRRLRPSPRSQRHISLVEDIPPVPPLPTTIGESSPSEAVLSPSSLPDPRATRNYSDPQGTVGDDSVSRAPPSAPAPFGPASTPQTASSSVVVSPVQTASPSPLVSGARTPSTHNSPSVFQGMTSATSSSTPSRATTGISAHCSTPSASRSPAVSSRSPVGASTPLRVSHDQPKPTPEFLAHDAVPSPARRNTSIFRSPKRRQKSTGVDANDTDKSPDRGEESGNIAGRLSRRSLVALGQLFKTSPKRNRAPQQQQQQHQQQQPLQQPQDPDTEMSSLNKSLSRLSFNRKRRQSVPAAKSPPTGLPKPNDDPRRMSEMPQSDRRRRESRASPTRGELSAYHTASAHGSRIPKASSMMRIVSRKSDEQKATARTPSRIPQSTSSHNFKHDEQLSRTPSIPSRIDAKEQAHRRGSPVRHDDDEKPVRVRTIRRSHAASSDSTAAAAEALVKHRALASASPSPSVHDEAAADEEMELHIKRFLQRRIAKGARPEDVEKELQFPVAGAASRRLSPRQAEVIYSNHLCPYEQRELYDYESIYYVGSHARHKHYAVAERPERNYGYDDERGDYIINSRDHIAFRYEIMKTLGRGSFGQVLQCRDHKTGRYVAVKLIRNKRRFHHQALVEVRIMDQLAKADADGNSCVVHMVDSFTFRNHLCVAMELLSMNLYELIKANSFAGFSTLLIRRFAVQTLRCLAVMADAHIVHCDLKPENILLVHPRRSAIKVIDFGSSCNEHEKVYTYIQSRFYRSPEVILGIDYNMAIDMWSLGCILSELHTGYPLFPGENEQDQLACIMEVLGTPDRAVLDRSTRRKIFFDSTGSPRTVVNSRGRRRRPSSRTLSDAVRSRDELFLDFIARCLAWDPAKRLTAEAALQHPWITTPSRSRSVTSMLPRVVDARHGHS